MRTQKILYKVGDDTYIRWKNEVVKTQNGYLAVKTPTNAYGYSIGKPDYPVFRATKNPETGITYLATIEIRGDRAIITPITPEHYPVN